jgi:hypothetical protein
VTESLPEALAAFPSVTVKLIVFVPLTAKLRWNVPVPVYGAVPPDAETMQSNGLPAVRPVLGQLTVTTSGCGAIVTESEPVALTAFASVTVKLCMKVPFVG